MVPRRTRLRASSGFALLAIGGALATGCASYDLAEVEIPVRVRPQRLDASVPSPDPPRDASVSTAPDAHSVDAAGAIDRENAADAADATDAAACGFAPCAPGQPCPDLVVDIDALKGSIGIDERTFAPTDCAVVEGCIAQPGARRLLRFDTGTANVGTADLRIGAPASNGCFEFSPCHQHYHFMGFGEYTLYETDGTTVAAVGHKQGFCVEDTEPYGAMPGPASTTPFTCTSQGLHVGWEDVYPSDIDCQWIDITGVPAGSYVLSVVVDPERLLPESDYGNNEARVTVIIQ
jgi:hypothetical protein